ncbi:hypothetical protein J1G43_02905 [Cellulomonas sp. zg-ZUI22]|uniref:hypothetical protein n=1 Tax=Cellulomonas sp. zg-ZUI22 TaxID=2816955 RepID=UPI001A94A65C|nr:hypothetical protein [Cellulomonas sp. zg-ZUI22]MBO0898915.1 hypothetical protein [Cellulomonas sp. zg-ZUI22]
MPAPLTAPDDTHLEALGLSVEAGDEPWVRSVSFAAERGGTVLLTWDVVGASAHLLWSADDDVVVELTREDVDTVTVDRHADGHLASVTSSSDGLTGALTLTVTAGCVRIRDTLLRS